MSVSNTKWELSGFFFFVRQGSNLDSNAKMWRLVADLMNDIGMFFCYVFFIHHASNS